MEKIKMYINSVVPEPISHDGKTGSIVRLEKILKEFAKLGMGGCITINSTQWMADYFKENGVDVEFRIVKSSQKFRGYLGLCLKSLFLIIKSFFVVGFPKASEGGKKVVVYSSSDLFWEVIPAFVYKIKNKKTEWIQIIHHIYPDWKKRPGSKIINFLGFYLQRFSLVLIRRKADKIIISNPLVKNELVRFGVDGKRMFVNPNGIDYEYFQAIQESNPIYDGVFLARLSHSKGVADLVDIWKKVSESIPHAKLAMIGGGNEDMKNMLAKKIKMRGLENNIDLLGFLEDSKAHPILKSGKVFVFPSHEEGWGIAIAEAMACGLPVVSWDLPNYRPVFENYTFQTKENDTKFFSDKVIELLEKENYRKEVGDKGRDFIKKYSWSGIAKRELEIINL